MSYFVDVRILEVSNLYHNIFLKYNLRLNVHARQQFDGFCQGEHSERIQVGVKSFSTNLEFSINLVSESGESTHVLIHKYPQPPPDKSMSVTEWITSKSLWDFIWHRDGLKDVYEI